MAETDYMIFTLLLCCAVVSPQDLGEYCEDELFKANCRGDEVIIIDKAIYGRMRTGRCVAWEGHMGCQADVQMSLDRVCSGRQSCEVQVSDILLDIQNPCQKDFRGYLEASYICVPVIPGTTGGCYSSTPVTVEAPSGYISSLVTKETQCGSIDTPWLIKAREGQKLNFTLYDFSLFNKRVAAGSERPLPENNICLVYAVLKETSHSETICGGRSRVSHVWLSTTNSLQLRMVGSRKQDADDGHFLLKYEAVGCYDPDPPKGGWMRRTSVRQAALGCAGSGTLWTLHCEGNNWKGDVGVCADALGSVTASPVLGKTNIPKGLSIVIVVGIALVVGLVILLVGLVCLRRIRGRAAAPRVVQPEVAVDPSKTITDIGYYGQNSENDYYRTWQMQQQQRACAGRTPSASLPPPPYRPLSTDSSFSVANSGRFAEHIYESPKFDRHPYEAAAGTDSGEGLPPGGKYFELESDAVHFGRRQSSRDVLNEPPVATHNSDASLLSPKLD
nr:Gal-binding and CUB domains containing receptor 15 [Arenicola marina]